MDDQTQGISEVSGDIDSRIENYFTPEPQAAVTETQPEPVPSSNEKNQTEEVDQKNEADVQPTASQEKALDSQDDLRLPEEVSERTRREFDKLKARLKDAESKLQPPPQNFSETSVFDIFHPEAGYQPQGQQPQVDASQFGNLNQGQVENITQQFIDSEGNVDINGLNQALRDANLRAQEATRLARETNEKLARFEETQQVREAHSVFPQLDPLKKDSFDPNFYELVRDRLVRNWSEGKKATLLETANEIARVYTPPQPQVNEAQIREQAVEDYKRSLENRNQGPIESGVGAVREQADADYQELRVKTRAGDDAALDERLKRVGVF